VRFGTDGVRGTVNGEITPELFTALGRAAVRVLGGDRLVVGRDTRASGPLLAAALAAGAAAEGADVEDLGVVPTPAVAWASAVDGVTGAVVSASHNPSTDNGLKLFGPGGAKLDDGHQGAIEAELAVLVSGGNPGGAPPAAVGRLAGRDRTEGYLASLLAGVGGGAGVDLRGLAVVLDCAHGAASVAAPELFRRAGARVSVRNDAPDGHNINVGCGSTDPRGLGEAVVAAGADCGLAFDGDADRVVAVDDRGRLVDGDEILVLAALDRAERDALPDRTVVVTVMANLGLREALAGAGIRVVETPVGDRHVLEALESGGWVLGGEQSGHVIFRDLATTGDGLLTGLSVCEVMVRRGLSLAALAGAMTRRPQVLEVAHVDPRGLDEAGEVWRAVAEVEERLGDRGRVVVRASGTEPVVRVMVEAHALDVARQACRDLCGALTRALGPAGG